MAAHSALCGTLSKIEEPSRASRAAVSVYGTSNIDSIVTAVNWIATLRKARSMSRLLRDRVIINQIVRISRTEGLNSITARKSKTVHHDHHHHITPKEHHRDQQDIHTTDHLHGSRAAAGIATSITTSHRHLPKTSTSSSSVGHPTASIPTSPAKLGKRTVSTSSQPPAEDQSGSPTQSTSSSSTMSTTKQDPALKSSTPPRPRSAQETQDATPCAAANESGPQPRTTQEQPVEPGQNAAAGAAGLAHPQALPAPPPRESVGGEGEAAGAAAGSSATTRLEVNGEGVKLDYLGPLVVHKDGTVSRIANWGEMTDVERKSTLRILGKRNQLRLDTLKGNDGRQSQ